MLFLICLYKLKEEEYKSLMAFWNRYPMLLLALGLIFTQSSVGALSREGTYFARSNVSSELTRTSSSRSISIIRILSDGRVEQLIRWPGACAREIIVNWGWAFSFLHLNITFKMKLNRIRQL